MSNKLMSILIGSLLLLSTTSFAADSYIPVESPQWLQHSGLGYVGGASPNLQSARCFLGGASYPTGCYQRPLSITFIVCTDPNEHTARVNGVERAISRMFSQFGNALPGNQMTVLHVPVNTCNSWDNSPFVGDVYIKSVSSSRGRYLASWKTLGDNSGALPFHDNMWVGSQISLARAETRNEWSGKSMEQKEQFIENVMFHEFMHMMGVPHQENIGFGCMSHASSQELFEQPCFLPFDWGQSIEEYRVFTNF